ATRTRPADQPGTKNPHLVQAPVTHRLWSVRSFSGKGETQRMSHIVSIKTKVHDPAAVAEACRRLQLAEPVQGTADLFSGEATGLIVKLPGWEYPAVIDTASGQIQYDNFEGRWGNDEELHRFLQAYAVEKTRLEARKKGLSISEHQLADGSIRLQLREGA